LDAVGVALDEEVRRLDPHHHLHVEATGPALVGGLLEDVTERKGAALEGHAPRLEPGEVEQLAHKAAEPLNLAQ
jgi:hypothetical protein